MAIPATVLCFSRKTGIGWASPDDGSNDAFLHRINIKSQRNYLVENDRITFEWGEHNGKPCALNIQLIGHVGISDTDFNLLVASGFRTRAVQS